MKVFIAAVVFTVVGYFAIDRFARYRRGRLMEEGTRLRAESWIRSCRQEIQKEAVAKSAIAGVSAAIGGFVFGVKGAKLGARLAGVLTKNPGCDEPPWYVTRYLNG